MEVRDDFMNLILLFQLYIASRDPVVSNAQLRFSYLYKSDLFLSLINDKIMFTKNCCKLKISLQWKCLICMPV